jgi:hypothetical protein
MRSLFAYGSDQNLLPGTPVAGVYIAVDYAHFLANCQEVVAKPLSVCVDPAGGSGGTIWYADGSGEQMVLMGGSVENAAALPALGEVVSGVILVAPDTSAIWDLDNQWFWVWDGTAWIQYEA